MIFETHAHYDDDKFNEDRTEILASMKENHVEYIVNVSSSLETIQKTIALMEEYDFIYGALGVHPSDCAELTDVSLSEIEKLCKTSKVVAVGEIGLDYYWPEPDHTLQKEWFQKQMDMARRVKLPIIVHSRDAAKDTMDLMVSAHAEEIGGVVHCYSYSKEMAKDFLEMGFYIGIGGVVTFSNAKKLKEVAEYVPLDRIVLETDSPYLAPVPNRGKRNSSLNLPYVAEEIAKIKGIDVETVYDVTFQNALKLYRIR